MKILLIFLTFYLISGAVRCFSVTGYSGASLLVDSQKLWYSSSAKYVVKHDPWRTIVNYRKHNEWISEGRFVLFCNKYGNLMIFIRELNTHDAGKYRIRVLNKWYIDITLNVNTDSCCKVPKTVKVKIGETAAFSCEYSQNHINDPKIIFKEQHNSIDELIHTSSTLNMEGRLSVSDDRHNKLMTVRITAVTPDDGGVYLCGVWIYRLFYSISGKVRLHIMAKVGVSRVTGHSGGRVMIKCEHPQYKTRPKYICKESDGCSERKNPGVQDEWMENGDVSLYDDTRAGVLMVFFRELKAADAGTYRCGVNVSDYTESFTELQLHVTHDAKYPKSVSITAYIGEEVNIFCQIPEEHEVYFCKEDDNHICQSISTSTVTQMSGSSERNEERVFTVSISNVSVRDAGVYWCGAETRDTYLTFISLTTNIQLNLIMSPVVRREGESAEIFCPYDSIYKSKSKSLCKGKCSTRDRNTLSETVREEKETKTDRLTLNDDATASVFTGTITGLTAEDAGKYWCAVTLERDVNYLYTHLIVIMNEELNLTKYEGDDMSIQCKHHEEHQKCFCKAHEPSMCVKDGVSLETIRDDRVSFSDEASTGVFTVDITDLREEDSGIYWCGSHIITKVNLTVNIDFFLINIISMCSTLLLIGGFTVTECLLR
ncbi:polymeric immunoglobulin receptor-like [Pseudorasbora parva]|uniref:polymeric immunoglobulin receptor-like n=1 Tax=Pseudorasbora parva TaxID=51549 RepID=UPI00351E6A09